MTKNYKSNQSLQLLVCNKYQYKNVSYILFENSQIKECEIKYFVIR